MIMRVHTLTYAWLLSVCLSVCPFICLSVSHSLCVSMSLTLSFSRSQLHSNQHKPPSVHTHTYIHFIFVTASTALCNRTDCPTENGGCSEEKCFCNNGYQLADNNTCELMGELSGPLLLYHYFDFIIFLYTAMLIYLFFLKVYEAK